jgi:hypothetical protein
LLPFTIGPTDRCVNGASGGVAADSVRCVVKLLSLGSFFWWLVSDETAIQQQIVHDLNAESATEGTHGAPGSQDDFQRDFPNQVGSASEVVSGHGTFLT